MIPLEDHFPVILGKAMRGFTEEKPLNALAAALMPKAPALWALARGRYQPTIEQPPNLAKVTTPCRNLLATSYSQAKEPDPFFA